MRDLSYLGISPTPWELVERECVNRKVIPHHVYDDLKHYDVGFRGDICLLSKEMRRSDARLIAAAPELYDALFRIVAAADDSVGDFAKWRKNLLAALNDARKALAKASGEEANQ